MLQSLSGNIGKKIKQQFGLISIIFLMPDKKLLIIFLVLLSSTCFSQSNNNLKLWYNKPSGTIWENALPIGNGKLGAMIYGNVDTETVQLNESTVWSGSPNRHANP